MDNNHDGALSAEEVSSTEYICNGSDGADGADGADGSNGADGTNQLVAVSVEEAGANCTYGGHKLDSGADTDTDGVLDADEVSATQYICTPEPSTQGTFLLTSEYIGEATEACPGGFVDNLYGVDDDGDAVLAEAVVDAGFLTCNQMPIITPAPMLLAESCAEAISITAVTHDVDGTIASYLWTVGVAGSELTLENADTATVSIAAGEHVAGAILRLVIADNFGAEVEQTYIVGFNGVSCAPSTQFYGIMPERCEVVSVSDAGDDRGGPIVTSTYVYYNGDNGLARMNLDLSELEVISPERIDSLFADRSSGTLYSLWHSSLVGGVLDQTSALTDEGQGHDGVWDQVVELDPETLIPTRTVALDPPLHSTSFQSEASGRVDVWASLIAANEGQLALGLNYRLGDWRNGSDHLRNAGRAGCSQG